MEAGISVRILSGTGKGESLNKQMGKRIAAAIFLLLATSAWIALLLWGPWIVDGDRLRTLTPGAGAAVNGFRTAVAAIGVGAAALVGILFTYQNYQLSRSAQYTERFAKAIEMLADESEARQLGGIYALERIMKDSAYDRPAIVETLASFVRSKSPAPELPDGDSGYIEGRKSPVPEAARAAFDVLARRSVNHSDPVIDLQRCDLRMIEHEEANLNHVNLSESHLGQAFLPGAKMRDAYLMRTKLTDTYLEYSDLSRSKFPEAEIDGVRLSGAVLDGANFAIAHGMTEDAVSEVKSCEQTIFPWTDLSGISVE
ncbi:pentapeptide repeat-containing protein [Streptomyces sp. CRN 30]|uniref:pentapeptide repeat-containing protein n=1 Tax=Streptomyces sp. CRN 30 TaxID=3075613 RepID=UPI002A7EEA3B|nr:pentapeptide repeat-containing protein [Streptomyces sp. CRN 30]